MAGPVSGPDVRLGAWLAAVAARTPAPGAGAVAAVTLAAAASLGAMVARHSRELAGADALATAADSISGRALALAAADEEAVGALLGPRDAARDTASGASPAQDAPDETTGGAARDARERAAEVPLGIAELAAELVPHLRRLLREGNRRLAGDASTGLELATAAGRAAAGLVAIDAGALAGPARGAVLSRQIGRAHV